MTNNPTIDGVSREKFVVFAICDTCAAETLCAEIGDDEHICGGCHFAPIHEAERNAEVAALQSTIAQLQARVAELESGRGEPVGWFTEDHVDYKSATTYTPAVADRWRSKGWPVTPLFTAPPAPVAVVLPDKSVLQDLSIKRYGYQTNQLCMLSGSELDWAWQACLDATAALNGQAK